jgi:hypothetical protein
LEQDSSKNPNDNILDIYGRVDIIETNWDDPSTPETETTDDPSTVGNAYGSYITVGNLPTNSANNNKVTLYPKEPPEGGSAGAMVSGNVIGAYVNTNDSSILIDAQHNKVDFQGARAGADENEWRMNGGYGAVIAGTNSTVTISGGVKNNSVIYGIDKDIVQLGGGAIKAEGNNITISGSADGNHVDLNNGDGKAVGISIFGGLISSKSADAGDVTISQTANAINNVVNLTGGTTIQAVIAGGIQVDKANQSGATVISGSAKNNTVNISCGDKIFGGINAGGITALNLKSGLNITGEVSGNTVNITGGDFSGAPIYAGRVFAAGLDGSSGGVYEIIGEIKNNTVDSSGSSGLRSIYGGSLEVSGISGAGTFNIIGDVSGNKIIGDGGRAGNIYVSYTEAIGQTLNITSDADNNEVRITEGVEGNPSYMSSISGAYVQIKGSGSGATKTITSGAHGNIVTIDGASITKDAIFGAYVTGSYGTVTGNTVNILGNTTFDDVILLYGGYTDGSGAVSGNILNLGTSGLTAYGVAAFSNINFDVSNANADDTIFTVTHGNGKGHPIFTGANFVNSDNGQIDLTGLNIGFMAGGGPDTKKIKLSDKIHLIAETSDSKFGFNNTSFSHADISQTIGDATYYYKVIVNNASTTGAAASYLDLFHNKIYATGNWNEDINVVAGDNSGEDVELKVDGKISSAALSAKSTANAAAKITAGGLDITAQDTAISLDRTLASNIDFGDITIGGGHILKIDIANNAGYKFGNNLNVYGANNRFTGDIDASGKNLNFYVEDNTPANSTILDVTGDADITGSNVVLSSAGNSTLLQVGDKINLIQAASINGSPSSATGTGVFGYTANAALDFVSTADTLYAVINEVTADKKTKSFSEGIAASLAFVGQGGELAAQDGIIAAVYSAEDKNGFSAFTAGSLGKSKYETGSYAEVSGFSFLAGLAKELNSYTLGAFLEYGTGSYDTNNSFGAAEVAGKGNASYTGGGVLGKFVNEDNYYFDFSGRLGQVKSDFNSADYVVNGLSAKYDYDALYYGLHFGAGHIWQISDGFKFDAYGRYLFTRQNGKEVSLPTSEKINFEASSSHRLRLGARGTFNDKAVLSPYAGLAMEYEYGGEVNATVQGLEVDAPSLKGSSGVGEFGLRINGKILEADLSAQGYAGKRRGLAGSFKLGYKF